MRFFNRLWCNINAKYDMFKIEKKSVMAVLYCLNFLWNDSVYKDQHWCVLPCAAFNLHSWVRLNLIDTEMHTLKIVVCYVSHSGSKSMLTLSLIHCWQVGESEGWGCWKKSRDWGCREDLQYLFSLLPHTAMTPALTQIQDARNGGHSSSPDWSSEMHGE